MFKLRQKNNLTNFQTQEPILVLSRLPCHNSAQSGFTLIESLVAILVTAILLIGLSPMVVMAVAARVQARRVDLATQAARGYINGLQSGAIAPPPKSSTVDFSKQDLGVAPPTTKPTESQYCFDVSQNGNCDDFEDLIIQAFRDGPANPTTPADIDNIKKRGYCLAVRVYRADAFQNGSHPTDTDQAMAFSGTLGDKNKPLVVMKTEITSSSSTKYEDYQRRFRTDPENIQSALKPNPTSCN